jgi:prepilin-type N-terminal cleavage/methylation domain-containing protein
VGQNNSDKYCRTVALSRSEKGGFSLIEVIVALAILGIAVVSLMQLFSGTLRTIKKSDDHSRATIYARSLLDEAYAIPDISDIETDLMFEDGFRAERRVRFITSEEGTLFYEVVVSVEWPSGKTEIRGTRAFYEDQI